MLMDLLNLVACTASNIHKHNKVIHKSDFPYYLNIRLPDYIANGYKLYNITNQSDVEPRCIDFIGCVQHDRIWLRINSAILDTSQGFHKYKLSFVCPKLNDSVLDLYISYTILDATEIKSYKYMDERRNKV